MLVLPVQYLPTDARMSAGLDTPEPVGQVCRRIAPNLRATGRNGEE